MRRDGKLCLTGRKKPEGALLRLALSKNSAIFLFLSLGLERFGREKSGNAEIMQGSHIRWYPGRYPGEEGPPSAVRPPVPQWYGKTGNTRIFPQLPHTALCPSGDYKAAGVPAWFVVIKGEVYSVIQPGRRSPPLFSTGRTPGQMGSTSST